MSDLIGANRLSILLNATNAQSDSETPSNEEAKNTETNVQQENQNTDIKEAIADKLVLQLPQQENQEPKQQEAQNQPQQKTEEQQQTQNEPTNTTPEQQKTEEQAETKISEVIKDKIENNDQKQEAEGEPKSAPTENQETKARETTFDADFEEETNTKTETASAQTEDYTSSRSKDTVSSHKKSAHALEIPPALKPYVSEPPDSLIYKTLMGTIPLNLEQDEYTNLLTNLSRYVDVCIDHDLIGEAVYVQGLANELRADKANQTPRIKASYDEIDKKIKETQYALDQVISHWDKEIEAIKEEKNTKLQILNEKYLQALDQLDQQWAAPERSQQYQKPSAELLNLRNMMTKMIKSRKLDHIDALTAQIEAREKEETAAMQKRMQEDYDVADKKLTKTYQTEQAIIVNYSDKLIQDVELTKQTNIKQYIKRIEILEREKFALLQKNKSLEQKPAEDEKQPTSRSMQKSARRAAKIFSEQKLPDFIATAKLKAPTFVPKKRDRAKSLSNMPTITKPKPHKSNPMSRLYDGI